MHLQEGAQGQLDRSWVAAWVGDQASRSDLLSVQLCQPVHCLLLQLWSLVLTSIPDSQNTHTRLRNKAEKPCIQNSGLVVVWKTKQAKCSCHCCHHQSTWLLLDLKIRHHA